MFVILGEALVDLIAQSGQNTLKYYLGGGPYNTAIALARLGAQVGFHHPISTDAYGKQIFAALQENNVDYVYPVFSECPTALALSTLDAQGKATYQFYQDGSAQRDVSATYLHQGIPERIQCLHTGTLAIAQMPEVGMILEVIQDLRKRGVLISVDPNLRLNCFADQQSYRKNALAILAQADIIKASDEDLCALYPNQSIDGAITALRQQAGHCRLLLITQGAESVQAYALHNSSITVSTRLEPPPIANLVDTIGAGDCFAAGMLYRCQERGVLTPEALEALTTADLSAIVHYANSVAALNCQQKGCNPPYRGDLLDHNEEPK